MLYGKPSPLGMMLRQASYLACCSKVLECMNACPIDRSMKEYLVGELPKSIFEWTLEMFCMGPSRRYADDIGTIIHWVAPKYPELLPDLFALSNKLIDVIYNKSDSSILTRTDWDLMHNGIEKYRSYLLSTPIRSGDW